MATIRENSGDAGADTGTQYTIALGDVFQGTLDPANDQDWIRIELTADGTIYDITLTDDNDSVAFFLYDLAGDHSISSGKYSPGVRKLILSPTVSGTYYIEVYSWDSGYSGNYELSLVENATPEGTYDEIADYMTDGYWEGRGEARRAFDVGPGGVLTVNITALTEEGKQLARWALEAWANVADITFEFVEDDNAHITFDDSEKFEGGVNDSIVNNTVIVSSSIRISSDIYDVAGTTIDSNTFRVYLHELGHALGLGHPGPYDGPGGYYGDNPMVAFLNDSYQASAVSYMRQDNNTWIDASFALPVTPMIADIIAVQNLYGVPNDINTGDTVYGYQSNVDGYLGEYFKQWAGDENSSPQTLRPTTLTLYDNGGNDTLDLRTDRTDQRVFLRPEGISDVYGLTGNLVIARDTIIENFVAGYGDDIVGGNAAANHLQGRDGNDGLWGSSGDDVLEGGRGNDRLNGGPGSDTFVFTPGHGNDTITDFESGTDRIDLADFIRLHSIDDVSITRNEADTLIDLSGYQGGTIKLAGFTGTLTASDFRLLILIEGTPADDTLTGGPGNEVLEGGAGADRLDGGDGMDWIEYGLSDAGVTVNLRDGTGEGGHAEGDVIADVENIRGSGYGDTLSGDDGVNHLMGGGGNDVLSGGAGADRLDGGAGVDWVSYQDSDAGVWDSGVFVDLEDGTVWRSHELDDGSVGDVIEDVITNVENITGTNYRDGLTGDNGANTLQGFDGDDELIGRGGADRLDGGAGTDRLFGGEDADVFIFAPGHGDDTIYDFSDNEDKVDLSAFDLAGFDDLTLSSASGGVTIDLTEHGGGTILLQNFDIADLDAADFIF